MTDTCPKCTRKLWPNKKGEMVCPICPPDIFIDIKSIESLSRQLEQARKRIEELEKEQIDLAMSYALEQTRQATEIGILQTSNAHSMSQVRRLTTQLDVKEKP